MTQQMAFLDRRDRHPGWMLRPQQVTQSQQQKDGDLTLLPNPVLASNQHRLLHQELLFCHRRGLLPRAKSELQRVMERKQREQHRQREMSLYPPSDLEIKLCLRQQRIQTSELEEQRRSESLQNAPEFVRVKGTLKHVGRFSE
ncbi:protein FAM107B [Cynoglossus semilaevis]|nr:protein FAM107B-like [Cynoglossus semilaevis]